MRRNFPNALRLLQLEVGCDTVTQDDQRSLTTLLRRYIAHQPLDRATDVERRFVALEDLLVDRNPAVARYLFSAATSELLTSVPYRGHEGRHFHHIADWELGPILAETSHLTEDDWNRNSRHSIPVQSETHALSLSFRSTKTVALRNDQSVRASSKARSFPCLMKLLHDFATEVGCGSLQLARLVRLKPRGHVYPHVDCGLYYLIRDRYHLVLQSPAGSRMQCESQVQMWYPGQLWWFNNHVKHQAFNEADQSRIHIIFDVLPFRNVSLAEYFQQFALSHAPKGRLTNSSRESPPEV
jgi:hypothetical protein